MINRYDVMHDDENSYKTILKRISAFGGVQIFSILANIVRGKFAAILLGPAGMGASSLFNNVATSLQQLAGLGLNMSMVKEVAASRKDPAYHSYVLSLASRLIPATALLGALLCAVMAPWLSEWTFGSKDYTFSFIMLSIGVAFAIAGTGYLALLQGLNEVKRLIYASLTGSLTGLFAGVPLYYFFGLKGIVPAIIVINLAVFIFYYTSYKKASKFEKVAFEKERDLPIAKRMISLGLIFMLGTLASSLTIYIVNTYIRYIGTLADVGFYQAAASLTNQYVAVLLAALAMDYFPRLTAASEHLGKMKEIANRQTEIILLIACPATLIVIVAAPLLVKLLLSNEFAPSTLLVRWFGFAVFQQAMIFPLGYYFLAKENKKIYVWLETIFTNLSWILLTLVLYPWLGLPGLGIGQVIKCIIDLGLNIYFCRKYYNFSYTPRALKIIILCSGLGVAGFSTSLIEDSLAAQIVAWATVACAGALSLYMLRNRMGEKEDFAQSENDNE